MLEICVAFENVKFVSLFQVCDMFADVLDIVDVFDIVHAFTVVEGVAF